MADVRHEADLDPRLEDDWKEARYSIQKQALENLVDMHTRLISMAKGKSKIPKEKEAKALQAYDRVTACLPLSKDIGVTKKVVEDEDIDTQILALLDKHKNGRVKENNEDV